MLELLAKIEKSEKTRGKKFDSIEEMDLELQKEIKEKVPPELVYRGIVNVRCYLEAFR